MQINRAMFVLLAAIACFVAAPPALAQGAESGSTARDQANTFCDCLDCPEMVMIPAGSFMMGSSEDEATPQRPVSFARAFAIARFEVTRGQYAAFSRASGRAVEGNCHRDRPNNDGSWERDPTGSWLDPGFTQDDQHPVVCTSWEDARAYVEWLNTQTQGGYRLLSEAEWEYAARAGSVGAYPWGEVASHEYANYGADQCCQGLASGRDQWIHTAPVGQFPANAFGLSDMHGNVWERTECDDDALDRAPNTGSACSAIRSGAWLVVPEGIRSTTRVRSSSLSDRYNYIGFRVARTLD